MLKNRQISLNQLFLVMTSVCVVVGLSRNLGLGVIELFILGILLVVTVLVSVFFHVLIAR